MFSYKTEWDFPEYAYHFSTFLHIQKRVLSVKV
jgi:hypothetical protein